MKLASIISISFILIATAACRNVPTNNGLKDTTGTKDTTVVRDTTPVALTAAIDGLVLKGPISPVSHIGVPNSAPLAGAPISISQDNTMRKPTMVTSDSAGRFYVRVAPGSYTLTPMPLATALPRPLDPSHITITANAVVKDTLNYDTGIR